MAYSKVHGEYQIDNVATFREVISAVWKRVGSGWYSTAFAKGRFVWKINTRTKGENRATNDGSLPYLRALLAGKIRSPHAPKVFRILVDAAGRFAVLMERLDATIADLGGDWETTLDGFKWKVRQDLFDALIRQGAPKSLVRFAKRIKERFSDWDTDMHLANIMLRGDTLVITDPLAQRF
jgi:predicted HNH restriction endonuclease